MSWVITGASKPPLLLDTYSGAAAAYSLRNLSLAYGGSVVRVRRSSDNTESDFTATQVSDGTLAAWVGAGNNGFVRTWYDQSGSGRNATQATVSLQPQIVTNGAVLNNNGKPTIDFIGDYLQTLSFGSIIAQPSTVSIVFNHASGNATYVFYDGIDVNNRQFLSTGGFQYTTSAALPLRNTPMSTGTKLITSVYNGASSGQFINGVNTINGDAGANSLGGLTIGSTYNGTANPPSTLYIQELICYPTNQTTNRAAIESNINAHYVIY